MLYKKHFIFSSDGNKLSGTLYAPLSSSVTPGILFIHGAGKSNRTRYFPWQEYLAQKGFSSFSFDVRGVGESEGTFEDGSLNNRLVDAENALQTFLATGKVDKNHLGVGGSSMGGHVAVRLIESNPWVKAIILGCAAAYGIEAEDKKLNETFTEVLRRENSWQDSKVFPLLKAYRGKILVLYGEEEAVIPKEVREKFVEIAQNKGGEVPYLANIGHKLLQPETEVQKIVAQKILKIVGEFLEKYL